jgi:hypothetical protein
VLPDPQMSLKTESPEVNSKSNQNIAKATIAKLEKKLLHCGTKEAPAKREQ